MFEGLDRAHGRVASIRICVPTKSEDAQMLELGVASEDDAENRKYFGNHDVSLEVHLEYIFAKRSQRGKATTRFTDGSIPVLYSALEPQTACTERAHWFLPETLPTTLQLVVIDFNGAHKDLTELSPQPPQLVGEQGDGSYAEAMPRRSPLTSVT